MVALEEQTPRQASIAADNILALFGYGFKQGPRNAALIISTDGGHRALLS
jgi:hypothetical protein